MKEQVVIVAVLMALSNLVSYQVGRLVGQDKLHDGRGATAGVSLWADETHCYLGATSALAVCKMMDGSVRARRPGAWPNADDWWYVVLKGYAPPSRIRVSCVSCVGKANEVDHYTVSETTGEYYLDVQVHCVRKSGRN
jgi:hypothetical protein